MPQKTTLYVIYMPYTLEEYNIGQLYTTCKVSAREAEGGMRVSVLENKPSEHENLGTCQYTDKIIDFSNKVSSIFRAVAPSGALAMKEVSYNAFPKCRTIYRSMALSDKKFISQVDTLFFPEYKPAIDPFNDMPASEKCEVIDIFREPYLAATENGKSPKDYSSEYPEGWEKNGKKVMTVFKRVQIDFHLTFIGKRYIGDIDKFFRKIFLQGHQELMHFHDEWKTKSLKDVRQEEERIKKLLEEKYPNKK
ncbi:hypothetical protein NEFER03_1086 [Nematocida sp. LUAm3]|nr:hypothetical protein NEFER03_1086 [Nematocida sp. LUAm3]KAI5175309.1 hypothetical protein NEFER02_1238 [Nematocida sp. LUAm2]KAI5177734.1 hypothetical protein NEFER01_0958 [Nematocida sp. LUAm1]